jgi:hypothetical protein
VKIDPKVSLLTTAEAARFLAVAPGTLKDWRTQRRRGGVTLGPRGPAFIKLSGRRTGGQVRYFMGDLLQFIRERRVPVKRQERLG